MKCLYIFNIINVEKLLALMLQTTSACEIYLDLCKVPSVRFLSDCMPFKLDHVHQAGNKVLIIIS